MTGSLPNSRIELLGDCLPVNAIAPGVRTPRHRALLGRISRVSLATAMVSGLVLAAGPVGPAAASPVGAFALFDIPDNSSTPEGIAKGSDGNMWFTERVGNRISRITPTGAITEFLIPTTTSIPAGITLGPDGNMWFTEREGNKIGRITPNGVITEFAIPTNGAVPHLSLIHI